jgi:hypothetical protein
MGFGRKWKNWGDAASDRRAEVGRIIFEQFGGRQAMAMIGGQATLLNLPHYGEGGLGIKWPNKQRSKGNYVEILLRPDDTYDMTFYNLTIRAKKPVKKFEGVYAEDLRRLFEDQTGWYLSLGGAGFGAHKKKGEAKAPTIYLTKSGSHWQVIAHGQAIAQHRSEEQAARAYLWYGGVPLEPWVYLGGITGEDRFIRRSELYAAGLQGLGALALGPHLTEAQIAAVREEVIREGVPVRFLHDGQNLNIVTGELLPRGTNVLHQMVYWGFPRSTSKKIAKWLGVKAVFSE